MIDFLKIARCVYKIANLPRIRLPQNILNQAIQYYYDFVNNDGKNANQITIIYFNPSTRKNVIGYIYNIDNIQQKIKTWKLYKYVKRFFNNKIMFCFTKDHYRNSMLTLDRSGILINVQENSSDFSNIKHQLQHYFEQMIIDEDTLKQFEEQAKNNNIDPNNRRSQYTQWISNSCMYIFDLYLKNYCGKYTFEDFYKTIIENRINKRNYDIDIKTFRWIYKTNSVIDFLTIIFNKNQTTYNKIKNSILRYYRKQIVKSKNINQLFKKSNFLQLQQIASNNDIDNKTIEKILQFLISNQKYKMVVYIIQHTHIHNFNEEFIINLKPIDIIKTLCYINNRTLEKQIIKIINSNEDIYKSVSNEIVFCNSTLQQKFREKYR